MGNRAPTVATNVLKVRKNALLLIKSNTKLMMQKIKNKIASCGPLKGVFMLRRHFRRIYGTKWIDKGNEEIALLFKIKKIKFQRKKGGPRI